MTCCKESHLRQNTRNIEARLCTKNADHWIVSIGNWRSTHNIQSHVLLASRGMLRCSVLVSGDPIPLTIQYVLVSNLCPECLAGSLDQEKAGDGRWSIEWYPVQCAVGSTPLVYSFQGSNDYYIKLQISNHRQARLSPLVSHCILLAHILCLPVVLRSESLDSGLSYFKADCL